MLRIHEPDLAGAAGGNDDCLRMDDVEVAGAGIDAGGAHDPGALLSTLV